MTIRVLVDPRRAYEIDDPTGTEYAFIEFDEKRKRIIRQLTWWDGFNHNAKEEMKERLQGMLSALDKPFLYQKVIAEFTEDFPGEQHYKNRVPIIWED